MSDHWRNIEGCIIEHQDFDTAKVWLARAKRELNADRFDIVLGELAKLSRKFPEDARITEPVLEILKEYDPAGDADRRAEIAEEKLRLNHEERVRIAAEERREKEKEEERQRQIECQKELRKRNRRKSKFKKGNPRFMNG